MSDTGVHADWKRDAQEAVLNVETERTGELRKAMEYALKERLPGLSQVEVPPAGLVQVEPGTEGAVVIRGESYALIEGKAPDVEAIQANLFSVDQWHDIPGAFGKKAGKAEDKTMWLVDVYGGPLDPDNAYFNVQFSARGWKSNDDPGQPEHELSISAVVPGKRLLQEKGDTSHACVALEHRCGQQVEAIRFSPKTEE